MSNPTPFPHISLKAPCYCFALFSVDILWLLVYLIPIRLFLHPLPTDSKFHEGRCCDWLHRPPPSPEAPALHPVHARSSRSICPTDRCMLSGYRKRTVVGLSLITQLLSFGIIRKFLELSFVYSVPLMRKPTQHCPHIEHYSIWCSQHLIHFIKE